MAPAELEHEQYFQQVLALERAMVHKMQELLRASRDRKLGGTIDDLLKEEARHEAFLVTLFAILNGVVQEEDHSYVFIRRLLDSILPKDDREKRRYVREPILGVARLQDLETGEECHAKCIDVSAGGIGIENGHAIPAGRQYRVNVEFYKYGAPLERTGKLVWMKEIIPGTFLGGFQFDGT